MTEHNHQENDFYHRIIEFVEEKKKPLIIGTLAVAAIVAGYFLYETYVSKPKQKESLELLAKVQDYFKQDSFRLVVNGAPGFKSAVQISSDYSGTKSGNLANYYAGVSYLKLGEYDNAIKYLKKFDSNGDKLVGALALACIGDAYVEKTEFKEGLNYYKQAIDYSINELTTPIHAQKALNVYIELKQYDDALQLIDRLNNEKNIPDDFKKELKKYQGLIEAKLGKYNPDVNKK
ncbi:MAG: hypothetical protein J5I91_04795 [Bacteroidetes bacterium]|nr:hypothetical protein [Bacteroidota bacterium]